jgi:hypothetical protein
MSICMKCGDTHAKSCEQNTERRNDLDAAKAMADKWRARAEELVELLAKANEIGRLRHELAIARSERDLALGKGEAIRVHNNVVKEHDAMHAELLAERERTDALVNALSYEGGPWPKKVGAAMQAIRDARGWDR